MSAERDDPLPLHTKMKAQGMYDMTIEQTVDLVAELRALLTAERAKAAALRSALDALESQAQFAGNILFNLKQRETGAFWGPRDAASCAEVQKNLDAAAKSARAALTTSGAKLAAAI